MAMVVQSVGTGTTASGTSLVITKPTGLAAGDLMVAVMSSHKAGDPWSGTFNTLSGWTSASGGNFATVTHSVQYKIADSGDAAASDFTFTSSGTARLIGKILRVTGHNTSVQVGTFDTTQTGSASSATFSGSLSSYTPGADGALFIIQTGGWTTSAVALSVSNYSCGGVTYSESYDDAGQGADAAVVSFAYGIQSPASAITTYTATFNNVLTDHHGQLVIFQPPISASGSNDLTTASSTTFTQSGTCDGIIGNTLATATSEAFIQSGSGTSPVVWSNPDKSSTSWNNPDKQ